MNRIAATALMLVVVMGGVFLWEYREAPWLAPLLGSNPQQLVFTKVAYACDEGKTITAFYYQGQPSPAASTSTNQPPTLTGSVMLSLSDGRTMTLQQTPSASGIRYANVDESLVFWSKGNSAFITEGNPATTTFADCITSSSLSGQEGWNTFTSSAYGFSVRYPQGYVPAAYVYQELGPGKNINGVKFTIPLAMATGTNLVDDTHISVEQLPNAGQCAADMFISLPKGVQVQTISDNGTGYSVASSTGAGAGNRYEEWVWAIPGTLPCIAVRYFIHYGVIENYPAGAVTEFDHEALVKEFDGIRQSLVVGK